MLVDLVLLDHRPKDRNTPKIRIVHQRFLELSPPGIVGMLRVVNTWSIHREGVTGSRKSGRAVLVTLFFRVAQSSVVIQAIL